MKNKGVKISAATRDLFQKVRELHLPFGEYALFGSCPLGIRDLKDCNDADIIVSKSLFEKFRGRFACFNKTLLSTLRHMVFVYSNKKSGKIKGVKLRRSAYLSYAHQIRNLD